MATEYKTGDTFPPISGTVTDANEDPVNISTATSARFIAKKQGGSGAPGETITGTATILDDNTLPLRGKWEYDWGPTDLSIAGTYEVEIEITWVVGQIETFPDAKTRNPTFELTADLD